MFCFRDDMNLSVRVVHSQLLMRNSVVACWCTELSLLSVGKKTICGFLKNVEKCWKKRCFFYWCSYTLCIQTIMNTNKVNVCARLLFTTLNHLGIMAFISYEVCRNTMLLLIWTNCQETAKLSQMREKSIKFSHWGDLTQQIFRIFAQLITYT